MNTVYAIAISACCHCAFGWWTKNTETGRGLKNFLQTWKTDSPLHLLLCAGSVFILGACAILALGLTLKALGA